MWNCASPSEALGSTTTFFLLISGLGFFLLTAVSELTLLPRVPEVGHIRGKQRGSSLALCFP